MLLKGAHLRDARGCHEGPVQRQSAGLAVIIIVMPRPSGPCAPPLPSFHRSDLARGQFPSSRQGSVALARGGAQARKAWGLWGDTPRSCCRPNAHRLLGGSSPDQIGGGAMAAATQRAPPHSLGAPGACQARHFVATERRHLVRNHGHPWSPDMDRPG